MKFFATILFVFYFFCNATRISNKADVTHKYSLNQSPKGIKPSGVGLFVLGEPKKNKKPNELFYIYVPNYLNLQEFFKDSNLNISVKELETVQNVFALPVVDMYLKDGTHNVFVPPLVGEAAAKCDEAINILKSHMQELKLFYYDDISYGSVRDSSGKTTYIATAKSMLGVLLPRLSGNFEPSVPENAPLLLLDPKTFKVVKEKNDPSNEIKQKILDQYELIDTTTSNDILLYKHKGAYMQLIMKIVGNDVTKKRNILHKLGNLRLDEDYHIHFTNHDQNVHDIPTIAAKESKMVCESGCENLDEKMHALYQHILR